MSAVEVMPDVEVDESELTQQPCAVFPRQRPTQCRKPAVGEDVLTCACGHVVTQPHCAEHIGGRAPDNPSGVVSCRACRLSGHRHDRWLIVSRYYTRRTQ